MPVIQHVKLGKYTILVLERSTKEQFGLKQQLKMVAAELLNVLRHDNVDGFPDNDESSGLEQLLVTPFWMFLFQNIAHPVVFPEPDSGVHHEPRYQAKSLLTDSQTHVFGSTITLALVFRVPQKFCYLFYRWKHSYRGYEKIPGQIL
ncbi:protein UL7 [Cynomolgus macaque cytomegalovirus strain Mauritius]|uniref:Protein UL7 n=1 Tax=Cynomolgus macaque cytomegalovirus strain Mauritius TaxID=1690255 RepID=A0A0K1H0L6_9BETA|nr:protein UL7 [Cynomolgus macaque cytomegalovirus strain Mauritius]